MFPVGFIYYLEESRLLIAVQPAKPFKLFGGFLRS
jgi:hypothetical protein